jgi:hypothetical protein
LQLQDDAGRTHVSDREEAKVNICFSSPAASASSGKRP